MLSAWNLFHKMPSRNGGPLSGRLILWKLKKRLLNPSERSMERMGPRMQSMEVTHRSPLNGSLDWSLDPVLIFRYLDVLCSQNHTSKIAPFVSSSHTSSKSDKPEKSLTPSWPQALRLAPCKRSGSTHKSLKSFTKLTASCPNAAESLINWPQVQLLLWKWDKTMRLRSWDSCVGHLILKLRENLSPIHWEPSSEVTGFRTQFTALICKKMDLLRLDSFSELSWVDKSIFYIFPFSIIINTEIVSNHINIFTAD